MIPHEGATVGILFSDGVLQRELKWGSHDIAGRV